MSIKPWVIRQDVAKHLRTADDTRHLRLIYATPKITARGHFAGIDSVLRCGFATDGEGDVS